MTKSKGKPKTSKEFKKFAILHYNRFWSDNITDYRKLYKMHIECALEAGYTAWQWVTLYNRYPMDDAIAKPKTYYDKTWYYYKFDQTRNITEDEYKKLKNIYEDRFGGWEIIDLEHTDYGGHAWITLNALS